MTGPTPPEALLLLAPGCPHCPRMLELLGQALKQGRIGRLEAVNILAHPERAQALGIRNLPWTRIGRFGFSGLISPGELERWIRHATLGTGTREYYANALAAQGLPQVLEMIREDPASLGELLRLLAEPDTRMIVRIGIGALMEELQGSEVIQGAISELGALTCSASPPTRADACHYLGLTASPEALPYVRSLLNDPDPQVREIAEESLHRLGA